MYSILWFTFLSMMTLWVIRTFRQKRSGKRRKFGRIILFLFVLFLWIFQTLRWTVPKGNIIHELTSLPIHGVKMFFSPKNNMVEYHYSFGGHSRQHLMIFQPKEDVLIKDKVIYYIHGGGWQLGSPKLFRPVAQYFVDKGYTVVLPAYRLLPKYSYPDMREDLTLGLEKALTILSEMGLGDKKILLVGDSAGGNLAAHLLYNRDELKKAAASQRIFAGFISIAGVLNIDELAESKVRDWYAGDEKEIGFLEANPFHYVREDETVPIYCIHGTKDGMVDYKCTKTFIEKINQKSPNLAKFLTISDGTHISVVGEWIYTENTVKDMINRWVEEIERL